MQNCLTDVSSAIMAVALASIDGATMPDFALRYPDSVSTHFVPTRSQESRRVLMVDPAPSPQPAVPRPRSSASRRPPGGAAYQLSSLLLVMSLVAMCLSICRLAPHLGILASVIAVLAWLRTAVAATRWSSHGQHLQVLTKIAFFLQSVTVVVCSGILIAATFLLSGSVVMLLGIASERILPLGGVGYAIGIISSGIVGTGTAALVAALVAKSLWPIPTTIKPLSGWYSSAVDVDYS